MKKTLNATLMVIAMLLFTGCTGSSEAVPDKSPSFKLGEKDGCTTATGTYIKDSDLFKNNPEYANGWFYGRKNCNPVQSRT